MKKIRRLITLILGLDGLKVTRQVEDIQWGLRLQSLCMGSKWFRGGAYPGGWAVGFPFLCVLYRVLDEFKPASILELGLGQSTKMTTSYMKSGLNTEAKVHFIVEHDKEWAEFMKNSVDFIKSKLILLPLVQKEYKGSTGMSYDKFSDVTGIEKYELILIDGPFGSEGEFSRVDILSIVPNCLADNFVIMVDDTERRGEKNMCNELCKILKKKNIDYVSSDYGGVKNFMVIASKSRRFACSMN